MIKRLKMTVEEWKCAVQKSSHVLEGEIVQFSEPNKEGYIRAEIIINDSRSVFLGTYFTKDSDRGIKAGTCWFHE